MCSIHLPSIMQLNQCIFKLCSTEQTYSFTCTTFIERYLICAHVEWPLSIPPLQVENDILEYMPRAVAWSFTVCVFLLPDVFAAFCNDIDSIAVSKGYGQVASFSYDALEDCKKAVERTEKRSLQLRNRWNLAYTLTKNPSLVQYRRKKATFDLIGIPGLS